MFWLGRISLFVCLLVAGRVFSFSIVPGTHWSLSFAALAIVFAVVLRYGIIQRNLLLLFSLLVFFSIGKWITGMGWIYNSLTNFGNFSDWLGWLTILTAAFCMSVFLLVFVGIMLYVYDKATRAWVSWKLSDDTSHQEPYYHHLGLIATLFSLAWLGMEIFRDNYSFFNVAWLNLGYFIVDSPSLAPTISVIGVYGVSFLLAMSISMIIAGSLKIYSELRLLSPPSQPQEQQQAQKINLSNAIDWSYFGIWIVTVLTVFGIASMGEDVKQMQPSSPEKLQLSLVHTSVNPARKWTAQGNRELWGQLISHSNQTADLIIWPEGIFSGALNSVKQTPEQESILKVMDRIGKPVLFGSITTDGERYFNSAVLYQAPSFAYYHKAKLVPFGEFTPKLFQFISKKLNIPYSLLTASQQDPAPLRLSTPSKQWQLGIVICYESNFADHVRLMALQSDFLVVITESQWFTPSLQPYQHLQMTRARAIENGKSIVFVNNGGPSAVIDPTGGIVKMSTHTTSANINYSMSDSSIATFYYKHGNLIRNIVALLVCFLLIINRVITIKNSKDR